MWAKLGESLDNGTLYIVHRFGNGIPFPQKSEKIGRHTFFCRTDIKNTKFGVSITGWCYVISGTPSPGFVPLSDIKRIARKEI